MAHLPREIFNQYFLTFDRGTDLERLDDQDHYVWNKRLSAALWEVLCDVEMALRSSIDRELGRLNVTESNQGSWIENVESLIGIDAFRYIARAKTFLSFRGTEMNHETVITELNFSFWRSLLTKRYKDTLWRNALRFSFPNAPTHQPEYIFTRVRHLHILRNRIAHHEPIHRRDIASDFQICIEVLTAISLAVAQWSADNSRVLDVLAQKPV